MKVRQIIHGARERVQLRWCRSARLKAYRYVRKAASKWNQPRVNLSLMLIALAMARRQKRMERFMKTRSYRKRADRILALARRTGGRIVHDAHSLCGRVVANLPAEALA
jgi:hypothetical protein